MNLTICKHDPADPSSVYLVEAKSVYTATSLDLTVVADDFKADRSSACQARLLRGNGESGEVVEYAACALYPDPYHRDRRVGVLVVGDSAHADLFKSLVTDGTPALFEDFILSVTLGASNAKVIYATVPVVVCPQEVTSPGGDSGDGSGGDSGGDTTTKVVTTASMWSHVDLGTVSISSAILHSSGAALPIALRDRSVTTVDIPIDDIAALQTYDVAIVPMSADGSEVFSGDFFEATLGVHTVVSGMPAHSTLWHYPWAPNYTTSRLNRILKGSSFKSDAAKGLEAFTWDYMDSFDIGSPIYKFAIGVRKSPVDDAWHATFRVVGAIPVGVDYDPEGSPVPKAGVSG